MHSMSLTSPSILSRGLFFASQINPCGSLVPLNSAFLTNPTHVCLITKQAEYTSKIIKVHSKLYRNSFSTFINLIYKGNYTQIRMCAMHKSHTLRKIQHVERHALRVPHVGRHALGQVQHVGACENM